jgi:beta-phosphoglucomutase-like phosphatase (HAD superfamily)
MPIRNFDLVMFDCDGVLVDSEPIINRAHAEVLSECGYQITPETLIERFCGTSDAEMLGIIESEWGRRLPADYEAQLPKLLTLIARKPWPLFLAFTRCLTGWICQRASPPAARCDGFGRALA